MGRTRWRPPGIYPQEKGGLQRNTPLYSFRSLQNALLANFGPLWVDFGRLLLSLGRLWMPLGRLLVTFGTTVGGLWASLGRLGRPNPKKTKKINSSFDILASKMITETFFYVGFSYTNLTLAMSRFQTRFWSTGRVGRVNIRASRFAPTRIGGTPFWGAL